MPVSQGDSASSAPEDFRWFHVVLTTYGSWLPGDPRGFRTRHHRENVAGDYKSPPPAGKYLARHRHSKALQRYPSVCLDPQWRSLVGRALVSRLMSLGSRVYCAAVSGCHAHLLAK